MLKSIKSPQGGYASGQAHLLDQVPVAHTFSYDLSAQYMRRHVRKDIDYAHLRNASHAERQPQYE